MFPCKSNKLCIVCLSYTFLLSYTKCQISAIYHYKSYNNKDDNIHKNKAQLDRRSLGKFCINLSKNEPNVG